MKTLVERNGMELNKNKDEDTRYFSIVKSCYWYPLNIFFVLLLLFYSSFFFLIDHLFIHRFIWHMEYLFTSQRYTHQFYFQSDMHIMLIMTKTSKIVNLFTFFSFNTSLSLYSNELPPLEVRLNPNWLMNLFWWHEKKNIFFFTIRVLRMTSY